MTRTRRPDARPTMSGLSHASLPAESQTATRPTSPWPAGSVFYGTVVVVTIAGRTGVPSSLRRHFPLASPFAPTAGRARNSSFASSRTLPESTLAASPACPLVNCSDGWSTGARSQATRGSVSPFLRKATRSACSCLLRLSGRMLGCLFDPPPPGAFGEV